MKVTKTAVSAATALALVAGTVVAAPANAADTTDASAATSTETEIAPKGAAVPNATADTEAKQFVKDFDKLPAGTTAEFKDGKKPTLVEGVTVDTVTIVVTEPGKEPVEVKGYAFPGEVPADFVGDKTEEPTTAAPADTTDKTDAPATDTTDKTEEPTTEAPADTPASETDKADASATETPVEDKTETPADNTAGDKTEEPTTEAPADTTDNTETPADETTDTDASATNPASKTVNAADVTDPTSVQPRDFVANADALPEGTTFEYTLNPFDYDGWEESGAVGVVEVKVPGVDEPFEVLAFVSASTADESTTEEPTTDAPADETTDTNAPVTDPTSEDFQNPYPIVQTVTNADRQKTRPVDFISNADEMPVGTTYSYSAYPFFEGWEESRAFGVVKIEFPNGETQSVTAIAYSGTGDAADDTADTGAEDTEQPSDGTTDEVDAAAGEFDVQQEIASINQILQLILVFVLLNFAMIAPIYGAIFPNAATDETA